MTKEKGLSSQEFEGTRIDLGDDLLEKTSVISQKDPEVEPETISSGSTEDLLQSAKILVNEGLLEDAKRVLRRIIVSDSENEIARQELNRIHEIELKQIFGEEERRPLRGKQLPPLQEFDSESVMRKLDQDLNLGVFSNAIHSVSLEQLSLFQDPDFFQGFYQQLEKDLQGSLAQDWIDLGIAFLEMDLFTIAARLFLGACRRIDVSDSNSREMELSATCLLALSLILSERPYEAISKIQPFLGDADLKQEQRVELFYLMGRTYESMSKIEPAYQFYRQVQELDSHYRDVDLRIRRSSMK